MNFVDGAEEALSRSSATIASACRVDARGAPSSRLERAASPPPRRVSTPPSAEEKVERGANCARARRAHARTRALPTRLDARTTLARARAHVVA
jgi:hypothetical protein